MSLKVAERLKKFYQDQFQGWFNKAEKSLTAWTLQSLPQKNRLLSPLVFIIAAVSAIFSFGLAIVSMISFFCSLLVLYFIITKIFGINLDWDDVVRV